MEIYTPEKKATKVLAVPLWFMITITLGLVGAAVQVTSAWVTQRGDTTRLLHAVADMGEQIRLAVVDASEAKKIAASALSEAAAARRDTELVKAWAAGVVGKPLPQDPR